MANNALINVVDVNNPSTTRRSVDLLPGYLRTDKNTKFLSSTIDQLLQPANIERISGFIGSTLTPNYNPTTDNYIPSVNNSQANYQLDPALIVRDTVQNIKKTIGYEDLINQISFENGNTTDHNRLLKSKIYSYNPHIDWDKFVNFNQYYWLPTGPSAVEITGPQLATVSTYSVTDDKTKQIFVFTPDGLTPDPLITLYRGMTYVFNINSSHEFYIKESVSAGATDSYPGATGVGVKKGQVILTLDHTAPSVLYYLAGEDPTIVGEFIVKNLDQNTKLDVEKEILGKVNYTSGNGITLTNGMKIRFNGEITPSSYNSNEYIVEGVGTAITLTAWADLQTPGAALTNLDTNFDGTSFDEYPFDDFTNIPVDPEYILINRGSLDGNAWARHNRWFHADVIKASAIANNVVPVYPLEQRAQRPIVEFNANLQLFNYGSIKIAGVDLIDNITTDAFNTVEGSVGFHIDQELLQEGYRVIFNADNDSLVRGRVYRVHFTTINGQSVISLVKEPDWIPTVGASTYCKRGLTEAGNNFWFDGNKWNYSQEKTSINQEPLFDVFDENGISYSDHTHYDSSFAGTKLFGYARGTGNPDTVLGFALQYLNVNNVGDFLFNNYFNTDTFAVIVNNVSYTYDVKNGYLKINGPSTTYANTWVETNDVSIPIIQNQIIVTATNNIEVIAIDNPGFVSDIYMDVFVNDKKQVFKTDYRLVSQSQQYFVYFTRILNVNDRVLLNIYTSAPPNDNGYYQPSLGLTNNPLNGPIKQMTLTEVSNHVKTITENTPGFVGVFPGAGNLRDLSELSGYGTRLISHVTPLSFAQLFLGDAEHNAIDAIRKIADHYHSYKLSLIQHITSLQGNYTPSDALDTVLINLNGGKNSTFPYAYSDMLAYGTDCVTRTYTVTDTRITNWSIPTPFDNTVLSERCVLIYLNGNQLIFGRDYEFNPSLPVVEFLIPLNLKDTITIKDYTSTVGSYVPPTPSKLGLYPKFIPSIYVDDTYQTPTKVIQGHDGSITMAFNDYRDNIILEFETRIYNNIKINYRPDLLDINDIIPGLFRQRDYSSFELNQMIAPEFLRWAGFFGIDYQTNSTINVNEPITWNYRPTSVDAIKKLPLPGHWRGIFKWFYDTDRPHTCPWEMLGFSVKPDWWTSVYGPAPYTKGNLILWSDLENGLIREGTRAGVDSLYVRPGLTSIIPVDESGNLLLPGQIGLITTPDLNLVDQAWVLGDSGPAETAFRKSSLWPFTVQILLAISRPALYASLCFDTSRINLNLANQYVYGDNRIFLNPSNLVLHRDIDAAGNRILASGYGVLLVEAGIIKTANYLKNLKQDLANINYNLLAKMNGFVSKDKLQIIIDAVDPTSANPGVLLPQEDYEISFNVSNPTDTFSASGFVIQKQDEGYTIRGYDKYKPYFTIYRPIRTSQDPGVNVGGISETFVVWTTGKFYQEGVLVENNNAYYRCKLSHTATTTFDQTKFQRLQSLPLTSGVTVLGALRFETKTTVIPYGITFTSLQEIYDAMVGYGEWLKGQGFVFDEVQGDLGEVLDWRFSGREFLYWTTQNWMSNSVITISPFADTVKFNMTTGTIDNLNDQFYEYSLLKADGTPYPGSQFKIYRQDNVFQIKTTNTTEGLFFVQFSTVQKEHVIVFRNASMFNDVIYDVETGYRQLRMRFQGFRTSNWKGDYSSPGFVYDEAAIQDWAQYTDYSAGDIVRYSGKYYATNVRIPGAQTFDFTVWSLLPEKPIPQLLPNLDYKINQFQDFYNLNIDNFDVAQQKMAQHLTGYSPRHYLDNIFDDPIAQYKFYQGYIKEKGTRNAIDKLAKASIHNLKGEISFNEVWAFRVGEYGGFNTYKEIEVSLDEPAFQENPQIIQFVNGNDVSPNKLIYYKQINDVLVQPQDYVITATFQTTVSTFNDNILSLPTAGYPRFDDVTATAFSKNSILDIANVKQLKEGDTIWVGFKENGDWDVLRYTAISPKVIAALMLDPTNKILQFTTDVAHKLQTGDVIAVTRFNSALDMCYIVISTPSATTFNVYSNAQNIPTPTVTPVGLMFKFVTARLAHFDDIKNYQALEHAGLGGTVWVDSDTLDGKGKWAVYQKIDNFTSNQVTNIFNKLNQRFGQTMASAPNTNLYVVGAPGLVNQLNQLQNPDVGGVSILQKPSIRSSTVNTLFNYTLQGTSSYYVSAIPANFGASILYETNSNLVFAGAPNASHVKADNTYFTVNERNNQFVITGELGLNPPITLVANQSYTFKLNLVNLNFNLTYANTTRLISNSIVSLSLVNNIGMSTSTVTGLGIKTGILTVTPLTSATISYCSLGTTTATSVFGNISIIPSTAGAGTQRVVLAQPGNNPKSVNYTGLVKISSLDVLNGIEYPNLVLASGNSSPNVNGFFGTAMTVQRSAGIKRLLVSEPGDPTNTQSPAGTIWGYNISSDGNHISSAQLTSDGKNYIKVPSVYTNASGFGQSISASDDLGFLAVGAPNFANGAGEVAVFAYTYTLTNTVLSNWSFSLVNNIVDNNTILGPGYSNVLSTSSVTVSTGNYNFNLNQIGSYKPGNRVRISYVNNSSISLIGTINSTNVTPDPTIALETTTVTASGAININLKTILDVQLGMRIIDPVVPVDTRVISINTVSNAIGISNPTLVQFPSGTVLNLNPDTQSTSTNVTIDTLTGDGFYYNSSIAHPNFQRISVDYINTSLGYLSYLPNSSARYQGPYFRNGDKIGQKVLMSSDGQYLAITAPMAKDGSKHGAVIICQNQNGKFVPIQDIRSPSGSADLRFGTDISWNHDATTLVITSVGNNYSQRTTLDTYSEKFENSVYLNDPSSLPRKVSTTFDSKSTNFYNLVTGSGAAHTYTRYNNYFAYGQELTSEYVDTDSAFGSSVLVTEDEILVGAPTKYLENETGNVVSSGEIVAFFEKDPSQHTWVKLRTQPDLVDLSSINQVVTIDNISESVQDYLEIIDPVKGRIPGDADANLSYKTLFDPAVYSLGITGVVVDSNTNWIDDHVGELWWDLSSVKYSWYEQGENEYRKNNWGTLFPGSTIDVYEWVSSSYLPSQWAALADTTDGLAQGISGQPRFPDNSVLSVKQVYNSVTTAFNNVYYYWVKNKTTIPSNSKNTFSAYDVARLIADPKSQGIKYAMVLGPDAIALSNLKTDLVSDKIHLHVSMDTITNAAPRHTEWLLIEENNPESVPNSLLEQKLFDSLLGHDSLGNPVPDTSLLDRNRYGVSIRPRQSLFVNRLNALRDLVEYINSVLTTQLLNGVVNFDNLNAKDPIPSIYLNEYDQTVEDYITLTLLETKYFSPGDISAEVDTNGRVVSLTINNPGRGYGKLVGLDRDSSGNYITWQGPAVTISGNGKGATASTVVDEEGRIIGYKMIESGFGYTYANVYLRPVTVTVLSDTNSFGKWAKYQWDGAYWNKVQTQSYDTTLYWQYVNWVAPSYNPLQTVVATVDSTYELDILKTTPPGNYVKVKNGGDGRYLILRKTPAGTTVGTFDPAWDLVVSENGTIQIKDTVWNLVNSIYAFDEISAFDQTLFDQAPDIELDYILRAIKDDIFVGTNLIYWNKLFFKAVKYALSEQKNLDWVFKTTFIDVVNHAGTLDQRPTYKLQDSSFYQSYIEEVKPYHTSIRNYTVNYTATDVSSTFLGDFDLPSYWDQNQKRFRTVGFGNSQLLLEPWKTWVSNYTYQIDKIVVSNPGSGYQAPPTVQIIPAPGDLGTGATAVAYISKGQIYYIELTNPGQGYAATPTVILNGGGGNVTTATAYAQLINNKIRSTNVTMKFDRVGYTREIGNTTFTDQWEADGSTFEWPMSWVPILDKTRITLKINGLPALYDQYSIAVKKEKTEVHPGTSYNKEFATLHLNFVPVIGTMIEITYPKSLDLYTAVDRVEDYYMPDSGMPGNELPQLMSGMEYSGVKLDTLPYNFTGGWDAIPYWSTGWDNYSLTSNYGSVINPQLQSYNSATILSAYLEKSQVDYNANTSTLGILYSQLDSTTATILVNTGLGAKVVDNPAYVALDLQISEIEAKLPAILSTISFYQSEINTVVNGNVIVQTPFEPTTNAYISVYLNGVRKDDNNYGMVWNVTTASSVNNSITVSADTPALSFRQISVTEMVAGYDYIKADTKHLYIGMPVKFVSSMSSYNNLVMGQIYYVTSIVDEQTFTVSSSKGGTEVTINSVKPAELLASPLALNYYFDINRLRESDPINFKPVIVNTTATQTFADNNSIALGTTVNVVPGMPVNFIGYPISGVSTTTQYTVRGVIDSTNITLTDPSNDQLFQFQNDVSTQTSVVIGGMFGNINQYQTFYVGTIFNDYTFTITRNRGDILNPWPINNGFGLMTATSILNQNADCQTILGTGVTTSTSIAWSAFDQSPNANNLVEFRATTDDGSILPSDIDSLDTIIDGGPLGGTVNGTILGVQPSDILIDGDTFLSSVASYAPEEMVPGQVQESVGISVFTQNHYANPLITSYRYLLDGVKRTFNFPGPVENQNSLIVIVGNTPLRRVRELADTLIPDTYIFDGSNRVITLSTNFVFPTDPTWISISAIAGSGNGLIETQTISNANTITNFVTASALGDIKDVYAVINGIPIPPTTTSTLGWSIGPALAMSGDTDPRAEITVYSPSVDNIGQQAAGLNNVQLWLFDQPQKAITEIREEINPALASTNVYNLGYPPGEAQPYHSQVIIELTQSGVTRRLLPPEIIYYVASNNQLVYSLNSAINYNRGIIDQSRLEVFVNGVLLANPVFDYFFNPNTNSVQFAQGSLKDGDAIAMVLLDNYEYTINDSRQLVISDNITIGANDTLRVISFNNTFRPKLVDMDGNIDPAYDPYLIRKEKFKGHVSNSYQLSTRPIFDSLYVWVEYNGQSLIADVDYSVDRINRIVNIDPSYYNGLDDNIVVISIASTPFEGVYGYKMFTDILGRTSYKRISAGNTTQLAQALLLADSTIIVNDASVLPAPNPTKNIPGVIYVAGERIEYFSKIQNILGQIRRGTLGTGAKNAISSGTLVIDQGVVQNMPVNEVTRSIRWVTKTTSTTFEPKFAGTDTYIMTSTIATYKKVVDIPVGASITVPTDTNTYIVRNSTTGTVGTWEIDVGSTALINYGTTSSITATWVSSVYTLTNVVDSPIPGVFTLTNFVPFVEKTNNFLHALTSTNAIPALEDQIEVHYGGLKLLKPTLTNIYAHDGNAAYDSSSTNSFGTSSNVMIMPEFRLTAVTNMTGYYHLTLNIPEGITAGREIAIYQRSGQLITPDSPAFTFVKESPAILPTDPYNTDTSVGAYYGGDAPIILETNDPLQAEDGSPLEGI